MHSFAANTGIAQPAMIASTTDVALHAAPIEPSWVHRGTPQARNAVLSRSADKTASTLVWDCTAGEFEWHYSIDETIYFLEGSAVISDGLLPPRRFVAGDVLFLPKGSVAYWQVESYVRKVAFCRRTQPWAVNMSLRAGRKAKRIGAKASRVLRTKLGAGTQVSGDEKQAWDNNNNNNGSFAEQFGL